MLKEQLEYFKSILPDDVYQDVNNIISSQQKEIELLKQYTRQPPQIYLGELFCDGYECNKKLICSRYSVAPKEKAAIDTKIFPYRTMVWSYWAREPIDEECRHFKEKNAPLSAMEKETGL